MGEIDYASDVMDLDWEPLFMELTDKELRDLLMQLAAQTAKLDFIQAELQRVHADLIEMKRTQRDVYVTRDEFDPVKRLVYGVVGLVLAAVITGLMALVLIQ